MLLGRQRERAALDLLLEAVRGGEGRALVLRGEAGAGKSALLAYLAEHATECRVAHAAGVESEMELTFAGLQQLCAPMLGLLERLPGPQRDALSVAFGLRSGDAPDPFLVGLAALGLLSQAADEQPVVCLVDDAQWVDRASLHALEFVARRLLADSVALVFAVRQSSHEQLLAGLPDVLVDGLPDADARALLASVIRWPLDERVRDRIVAETRGNPLALLELPRGLTPAELADGFGLQDITPLPGRIEDSFTRRLAALPANTRQLLLVAAVEPVGERTLIWRAAAQLGIEVDAADAAESDGLVELSAQVIFRHPLVRSAIYRAALPQERRDAHRALAEVTDPRLEPERRAWHLAQATSGPDEDVSAELERCAGRAQARGGLAAAAAFLERSAALTLDASRHASRALAAARANAGAGAFDAALRLLAAAEAGPLDELELAQADLMRGQIAFASGHGDDASAMLLKAAKRLEPLDVALARETYLEALSTAAYASRLVTASGIREAAEAARAAPQSSPPTASDLLLDGLALLITERFAAAEPTLRRAVSAFSAESIGKEQALRWLPLACSVAVRLWDDDSWERLTTRHVQLARDSGALGVLPIALNQRAGLHLIRGEFADAASLIDEATAIAEATGSQLPIYASLGLAAFRGREGQLPDLIETAMPPGQGVGPALLQWARAVFYNGLGQYSDALAAAQQAGGHELVFATWAAAELIEAAARSGVPEDAAGAMQRLMDSTRPSDSAWARGTEACARALLADDETAERSYREALDRLGRTNARVALARAHLLYGEWLRRERRRTDARVQLRTAHEMFVTMGADGFAERARRELLATGETARKRTIATNSQLTAQESQVARLARDGLSNPEIGARLFISTSTVQYHLHKVFTKLGITSRMHLDRALPADPNDAAGA